MGNKRVSRRCVYICASATPEEREKLRSYSKMTGKDQGQIVREALTSWYRKRDKEIEEALK